MSTSNSTLASYATSGYLLVKGMIVSFTAQIAALPFDAKIGIALGLATYLTSCFFQWRRDRREERNLNRQRGAVNPRALPVIAAGVLIAAGATHQVTQRQYDFTSGWEGVRYVAYPDPANPKILTVCRGITNAAAPGWVVQNKRYTQQECFDKEVELMQNVFAPAIARVVKVTTTQQQREMLGDFTWNKGLPNFSTSTLLRKLNAGDCQGAADEFDRWVYGGGRKWAWIGRRMDAEEGNFRRWCK